MSDELKQRIVARLRAAGVDGMHVEDLQEDTASHLGEVYVFGEALDALRDAGTIEAIGAFQRRLSLRKWGRLLAEEAAHGGGNVAMRLERLLAGHEWNNEEAETT